MDNLVGWLLDGEPWVEYRTRVDLIGQTENESDVINARKKMVNHPKIQTLLKELTNWLGQVLSSHKSAKQPFHKLSFIADIGLKKDDPPIDEIIEKYSRINLMKDHSNFQQKFRKVMADLEPKNGHGLYVMLQLLFIL